MCRRWAGARTLRPTEIGTVVNGLLVKNFPYIFDTKYTARWKKSSTTSKTARRSGPICSAASTGTLKKSLQSR